MKRIVLFSLALFSFSELVAQAGPIKELYAIYYYSSDSTLRAKALNRIAVYYLNNNLDSAQKYAQAIEDISNRNNNPRWKARLYSLRADIAGRKNNYTEQINLQTKALEILTGVNDEEGIMRCNARLAAIYSQIQDNVRAREHIQKFTNDSAKMPARNRNYSVSRINNTKAEIAIAEKNYKAALEYCQKAEVQGIKARQEKWVMARIYYNTGRAFEGLHNYSLAEQNLRKALLISGGENDLDGAAKIKNELAAIELIKGNARRALDSLKNAEPFISRQSDKKELLTCYLSFIGIYDSLKDYQMKSVYLQKYLKLKDTLNLQSFNKSLAEAKTKFKTREKEKENQVLMQKTQLQELEIKQGRLGLLVLLVASILFSLLFVLIYLQVRLRNRQNTIKIEQQLLRSQMNPHFLFNSLNAIESFIYTNEPAKAGKYLSDFARLMRLILENSRQEFISLKQETDTLTYYLQLQKLRFNDTFDFKIISSGTITAADFQIPPMLAQPFIENAIEHGLSLRPGGGLVEVIFSHTNDNLQVEVKDNGKGFDADSLSEGSTKHHKPLAISITNERLKLLNRGKQAKINLSIENIKSSNGSITGSRVTFTIPVKLTQKI